MKLTVNQKAPAFPELTAAKGKWVLVYFYPKDFTSGCITEACQFRDHFTELSKRVTILGISGDTAESHKKFAEKYSLPFTLVADPDRAIIKAYGADGFLFSKRTSFLVGPDGVIKKIYEKVDPKTHAEEILADLP